MAGAVRVGCDHTTCTSDPLGDEACWLKASMCRYGQGHCPRCVKLCDGAGAWMLPLCTLGGLAVGSPAKLLELGLAIVVDLRGLTLVVALLVLLVTATLYRLWLRTAPVRQLGCSA
jgi:hypothetical protein